MSAAGAWAATGDTVLASRATGADGIKGNGSSYGLLSADGRHVAFGSTARNLDPADGDASPDVFVRDLRARRTTLVSRADGLDGVKGNNDSLAGAVSGDGRYVVFSSTASNLDPADTDTNTDVYVRDLETGETTLVSRADGAAGPKGDGDSPRGRVSADGRYVAFSSWASNLDPADTDPGPDVFVRDLQSDQTVLMTPGAEAAELAALSADGLHVAFIVRGVNRPETDLIGVLYVRHVLTGQTTLVSRADGADGVVANRHSRRAGVSLSADGRYVAFSSRASNLDPADTDNKGDLYVRDLRAHETTLVSRADGPGGAKGNKSSGTGGSLSADGRYVAFWSYAWNLDPVDSYTDLGADVFVRDLRTARTTLASRSQSGAKGRRSSYFPSLSADGRFVAFSSGALNFDPADRDHIDDVYVRDLHAALPPAGRAPRSWIDGVRVIGNLAPRHLLAVGRARDDHEVQRVEVSLTRRLPNRRGCELLTEAWIPSPAAGRGCMPRFLVAARFTKRWSRRWRPDEGIARGTYQLSSRAVDTAGRRETRFSAKRGNRLTFRVR